MGQTAGCARSSLLSSAIFDHLASAIAYGGSAKHMEIRNISWEQTIPLRQSVLWPNKPPEYCHVYGDNDAMHFGAFANDKLVCFASVYITSDKARLRKFATKTDYQGQGYWLSNAKVYSSLPQ